MLLGRGMTLPSSSSSALLTSNSLKAVKIEKVRGPAPTNVDPPPPPSSLPLGLSLLVEVDDDEQLDGD